jgi:hypothetical protein
LDIALTIFDPGNKTLFCTNLICQLLLSEFGLVPLFPDQFSDHEGFCLYLEFRTFFGAPSAVAFAQVFFKRGNLFFCCQWIYLFVKYPLINLTAIFISSRVIARRFHRLFLEAIKKDDQFPLIEAAEHPKDRMSNFYPNLIQPLLSFNMLQKLFRHMICMRDKKKDIVYLFLYFLTLPVEKILKIMPIKQQLPDLFRDIKLT